MVNETTFITQYSLTAVMVTVAMHDIGILLICQPDGRLFRDLR